jgi:hypothetical protein
MMPLNASSSRCHQIISKLCSNYLETTPAAGIETQPDTPVLKVYDEQPPQQVLETTSPWPGTEPVGESPETQINNVFSMMWPNVPPLEAADVVMGDEFGWMEFLRSGSADNWDGSLW